MGYNDNAHLAKFQWDIIHDSKAGETEFESSEEVMMMGNDDGQPIDTVKATKKVKELVTVLQERIREYLKNSTDKYQKLSFENETILSSISQFDPTLGAGGMYKNGKLYVGTRNFKESADDEDILATIYHEYMHYLNWQFGDRYRMENLVEGRVYQKTVDCFEKRMQTETDFLENVYREFYADKLKKTEWENYLDYPESYEELNNEQKKEIQTYIEEKKLKPEVVCMSYQYSPSNYFKDEINAHTETLNANSKEVFKMSNEKIGVYSNEINRYTSLYNKAKEYEINNNINSDGYEK
jgi:hypothetical protein